MTDQELDDLFEAARSEAELPSGDVMARILADADAEQSRISGARASAADRPTETPGLWSQLVSALGGWPSLAGLATAALAGVWIGANPPSTLDYAALSLFSDSSYAMVDMMPWTEFDQGEGAL